MAKVKNSNRVSRRKWQEWSPTAQQTFNLTYAFLLDNQRLLTHPKAKAIPMLHWLTLAWNSAWIAADVVDDSIPDAEELKSKKQKSKGSR